MCYFFLAMQHFFEGNKMKTILILPIVIGLSLNLFAQQPDRNAKSNEETSFINIENKNNVNVNSGIYEGDCTRYAGQQLKDCMTCLDTKNLKENFVRLNSRATHYYLKSLNTKEEKSEFLSHFTEEEWLAWWQQLDLNSQKILPKTKKEQLDQFNAPFMHYDMLFHLTYVLFKINTGI